MGVDHLQDEPKLILTYPHKSTFNRIGFSSMVSLSFIVLWILNHLMSYNTDFSDKIIMAIVLVGAPLLIWFMGYYLFINCLLYTSPSPRDGATSRMPSSA